MRAPESSSRRRIRHGTKPYTWDAWIDAARNGSQCMLRCAWNSSEILRPPSVAVTPCDRHVFSMMLKPCRIMGSQQHSSSSR